MVSKVTNSRQKTTMSSKQRICLQWFYLNIIKPIEYFCVHKENFYFIQWFLLLIVRIGRHVYVTSFITSDALVILFQT